MECPIGSHNPSVYRELLTQFREGYAKYSNAFLELEGLTDEVRYGLSEDEKSCQVKRLGLVSWPRAKPEPAMFGFWAWGSIGTPCLPSNKDEIESYAPYWRDKAVRECSLEALKHFRPLAERAGAHLPINILDGFPYPAMDAGSRWYSLLWWMLNPDHDSSQPEGIETITSSPFEDSARIIEWCGLTGDSPAFPSKKAIKTPPSDAYQVNPSAKDLIHLPNPLQEPDGQGAKPVAQSKSGSVQLFGRAEPPIVNGNQKRVLTKARYDVVMVLIEAGDGGLSMKTLEDNSKHTEPQKRLYELCKDDDWKQAIRLPGRNGQGTGYRIP